MKQREARKTCWGVCGVNVGYNLRQHISHWKALVVIDVTLWQCSFLFRFLPLCPLLRTKAFTVLSLTCLHSLNKRSNHLNYRKKMTPSALHDQQQKPAQQHGE